MVEVPHEEHRQSVWAKEAELDRVVIHRDHEDIVLSKTGMHAQRMPASYRCRDELPDKE